MGATRRVCVLAALGSVLAVSACGSDDATDAQAAGSEDGTTTTTTTTTAASVPAAEVESVDVGGESRDVVDEPAPLPVPPDGSSPLLDAMNASLRVEVLDPRTVEVHFVGNHCRAVGREVGVGSGSGAPELAVRVGTTEACVADPAASVPAVESAVAVDYVVRVHLDGDLPGDVVPEVELVA